MLADGVRRQTEQIFQNIDFVLADLDEGLMGQRMGGFLVWKQAYHLVHSLDKNYMDPGAFTEPNFQTPNLDVIYRDEGKPLSLAEIRSYYAEVRQRISSFNAALTDASLAEMVSAFGKEYSRLELIMAQLRHVFYHVGYFHCWIKLEKGRTPEYIGLYKIK
jgi:uncharacterized damage-inducible protein DinB